MARLLEADSTLLDLPVQGNLTLMDALPRAQEVCKGLRPPLLAIYHVLKAAGARPSMVAAIRANDLATVERFLAKDPRSAIESPTGGTIEPNRAWGSNFVMAADNGHLAIVERMLEATVVPETHLRGAMQRTLLNNHFAVAERLLATSVAFQFDLLGNAEFQNPTGMRWELEHGADPNANAGQALKMLLATYTRRTGPKHACIDLLIAHGAARTDDPVMAIHRGRADRLAGFLDREPGLVHKRVALDYGVHLSLGDVTLLHVAVEYNERDCVDLLLARGANLNARAGYDDAGLGGQTPLYQAIGGNQGSLFAMFRDLMALGPDLDVTARIQYAPLSESPADIEELTPLGYARRYAVGPTWRQSVEKLKSSLQR